MIDFWIFKQYFCISLASKSTCWFHNLKDTENRVRLDTLVGLNRFYSRKRKSYVYSLVFGRLSFYYSYNPWRPE